MPASTVTLEAVAAGDGEALATLRVEAMRDSLERVRRFDPQRARDRFLDTFEPRFTRAVLQRGQRVGFVVVRPYRDDLLLDHLYIHPSHQGRGIGAAVLEAVFAEVDAQGANLRVTALRGSDSNRFYRSHGFELAEEAEFDIHYVRMRANKLPADAPSMDHPVFVALDFDTEAEALAIVERLGEAASHYKVGLQTLAAAGPGLVQALVSSGKHVFLDLKLHEIPASVSGAVRVAGKLGVSFITVHASAGSAVLRAAVEAAASFPQLRVLGLTVITSLGDADLPELGLPPSVDNQVMRLAALAQSAGCHGVVASVREAELLRSVLPPKALIVCPGIQLPDSGANDQVRVASPAVAARCGATHIVVGRAVTAAPDPLAAFQSCVTRFASSR